MASCLDFTIMMGLPVILLFSATLAESGAKFVTRSSLSFLSTFSAAFISDSSLSAVFCHDGVGSLLFLLGNRLVTSATLTLA